MENNSSIKLFAGILLLVLFACILTACGEKKKETSVAPSGQVVIPVEEEFMQGNILNKGGASTGSLMYEGLVTRNREGSYDGWLAKSWEVSQDAATWTFHLVTDARWHDNQPFTSEDVKFTHDYIKAKKLWLSSVLSTVDHVECTDKYTAVFYLKSSDGAFLDKISHCPGIPIIPKHIWQNTDNPEHYEDNQYVGTGPFKFVNRISSELVKLEANEDYHANKPHVKEVIFKVIKNKDAQILALKSGDVDAVGDIIPAIADSLKGTKNIKVYNV